MTFSSPLHSPSIRRHRRANRSSGAISARSASNITPASNSRYAQNASAPRLNAKMRSCRLRKPPLTSTSEQLRRSACPFAPSVSRRARSTDASARWGSTGSHPSSKASVSSSTRTSAPACTACTAVCAKRCRHSARLSATDCAIESVCVRNSVGSDSSVSAPSVSHACSMASEGTMWLSRRRLRRNGWGSSR